MQYLCKKNVHDISVPQPIHCVHNTHSAPDKRRAVQPVICVIIFYDRRRAAQSSLSYTDCIGRLLFDHNAKMTEDKYMPRTFFLRPPAQWLV